MRCLAARLPNGLLLAVALVLSSPALAGPALAGPAYHYSVDAANSDVKARVAFFGLASKTAQFPQVSGGIELSPDKLDSINLDVTLDARALKAGDSVTLNRLRGPNFFDVERYPTVHFVGQRMTMTGPLSADVPGELTVRGITRPTLLKVSFARDPSQLSGHDPVELIGRTTINRRDFGMTAWSMIVGNQVTITIKARMVPG